jgi:hypothetical protein
VDIIRIDLWEQGVYRVLVGKAGGKRPLGRRRRRGVDDIRKELRDEGGV